MYGFIIPAKGRELIASLLAGDTLTITRCMVGEGTPQEEVEPSELTDLVKPIAQATSTAPIVTRQQVDMTVEYRNDLNGGLDNGFYLSEFGIFARGKTGEEVMIYYGCLGEYPQYVQPYTDGGAIEVRRFPISIGVSNTSDVHLDYNADAFLTSENLVEYCQTVVLPLFLEEVKKLIAEHSTSKRCARFVVGTSAAGWTAKDVDYLCDGTDDQAEIYAAIQALPRSGGEIVILDGTYNINGGISNSGNANISLIGNGPSTRLLRVNAHVGSVVSLNDNSAIYNLTVDGNKDNVSSNYTLHGINALGSNVTISNLHIVNCRDDGIYFSKNNVIIRDCIISHCNNGVTAKSSARNCIVMSNILYDNTKAGISFDGKQSTIVCNNITNGTSNVYTSSQHTILLNSLSKNNLVTGNNCMGKAPINSGTGNMVTNNKY